MDLMKKLTIKYRSFLYLLHELKFLVFNIFILCRLKLNETYTVLVTPIRIGDNIIQMPFYSSFEPKCTILLNYERSIFCRFLTAHRNIIYMRFYFNSIHKFNLCLLQLTFKRIDLEKVIYCSIFHGFNELIVFRWLFKSVNKAKKMVYEGETIHFYDINIIHLRNYTIVKNSLRKSNASIIDFHHLFHLQLYWNKLGIDIDELRFRNYFKKIKEKN